MIRSLLFSVVMMFCFTLAAQEGVDGLDKVEYFTGLIEKEPDNIMLYNNRAEAYLQANDMASAMADLNKIIELYKAAPKDKEQDIVAVAYYKLSEARLKDQKPDAALSFIASAIKLFPNEKTYLLHEARILATIPEEHDKAEQKFDALVSKFGDDEKILMEYASFLMPTDANKAVVLYEKVLRLNVMNKHALAALGKHFMSSAADETDKGLVTAYRDKAIGYYELLYTIEPQRPGLKQSLKDLYTAQGRTADLQKLK